MLTYNVFHAARLGTDPEAFPAGYRLVATIEAPSRNRVFQLTNHFIAGWHEGSHVKRLFDPRPRSTVVGDVVLDEGGMLWACAPVGWSTLPDSLGEKAREIVESFPEPADLIVQRSGDRVLVRTRHPMLRLAIEGWASYGTGRGAQHESPDFYGRPATDQYPPNPPPDTELTEWSLKPDRAASLLRSIDHALSPTEIARYFDTDEHGEERAAAMIVADALRTLLRAEHEAFAAYRAADRGIITAAHAEDVAGPREEKPR